jgi:DNA-directed RNA polymerase subunit M/transcription elongation factor TFIIS
VAADPNLLYCPKPGCNTVLHKTDAVNGVITCPQCGEEEDLRQRTAEEEETRCEMLA